MPLVLTRGVGQSVIIGDYELTITAVRKDSYGFVVHGRTLDIRKSKAYYEADVYIDRPFVSFKAKRKAGTEDVKLLITAPRNIIISRKELL